MKDLIVKISARVLTKIAAWLPLKNEVFVVGGYRYPVDEFLSYSQQKRAQILRDSGASSEDIRRTELFLDEVRKNRKQA